MSNSTAQVLMKKGKRGAAAYIHADCENGSPQHLGPLLDVLLNPSKAIDEWETIDWCRWLLAGGRTPDEFATIGEFVHITVFFKICIVVCRLCTTVTTIALHKLT